MRPDGRPEGWRQAMAWLHTWSGLVLGWLLLAIFVTGSLAFFRHEINAWMRPELAHAGRANTATLGLAEQRLRELAPHAPQWSIRLPDEREDAVQLFWREPAQGQGRPRFESRTMDAATGRLIEPRPTMGGDFFYRFHFELRSAEKSRWIVEGRWVVGLATLAMFVALLSGIVTHRRVFSDFFTFRPGKAGARSWLDAHNVSGVLVLPFYLLITFSGLMMFHTLYLPAGIAAAYGPGGKGYFEELSGQTPGGASRQRGARAPAAGPMPALALPAAVREAQAHWPAGRVERVSIERDRAGKVWVDVAAHDGDRVQYRAPTLRFDGVSGRLVQVTDAQAPMARTYGVLYGLHIARFASPGLRWTLFGFGLLGSAMIATGLVLWVVKRRAEAARRGAAVPGAGQRIVEAFNLAAIAGLPLAVAAYLLANRLLPVSWPERADWEIRAFFLAWLACLFAASIRRDARAWRMAFGAAALAWAAVPVLNALTTPSMGLLAMASQGQWRVAAVDLSALVAAVLFATCAWRIDRPSTAAAARPVPKGRRSRETGVAPTGAARGGA